MDFQLTASFWAKHSRIPVTFIILVCLIHQGSAAATTATDFRIVADPQDVATDVNGNIFLHCQYNDLVECVWLRNGKPAPISGHLHYVTSADGHGTTDCSIRIDPVKDIDFGTWQCEVRIDGMSKRSRIAHVTKNP